MNYDSLASKDSVKKVMTGSSTTLNQIGFTDLFYVFTSNNVHG